MRIAYFTESYISLQRVAADYLRVLERKHTLVKDPSDADVIILHTHITALEALQQKLPKKRTIGYLVWETDRLQQSWVPMLQRLDEIWTPSTFSAQVFKKHHAHVHVIPHVVRPLLEPTAQERAFIRGVVHREEGERIILGISTADDRRKNIAQLYRVFPHIRAAVPGARLVLKMSGGHGEDHERRATVIQGQLTNGQMRALYEEADAYVSPHRGEGWGLSLSDAMQTGTLAVGTAHSGNMDFMDERCSILIPCTVGADAEGRGGDSKYFRNDSAWATIRDADLVAAVVRACTGDHTEMKAAARASVARFTPEAVGERIEERLLGASRG